MKNMLVGIVMMAGFATSVWAEDTVLQLPLADVLAMPEAKTKLDGSVRFYLQGQITPKVIEKKGEDVSNKKTNGVGKDNIASCRWAALSALIAFQNKAKQTGANAVVDIVSFYKKNTVSNPSTYECHAGFIMTGVALKGTYAKVQ